MSRLTPGAIGTLATSPSGTQDTNIIQVGGASLALGQATMANSLPVAIASNQTAIPVSQSGTWDEVGINDSGNSITVDNAGTFAVQADTEPPTAAALVDATANPTTPIVATANEVYNGTTWDRIRAISISEGGDGTGVLGAGIWLFDGGTAYYRLQGENQSSDASTASKVGAVVSARLNFFNGTSFDRARGDTTNGLDVDVTRSALPSGAATLAEQQTQTTSLSVLDDWDNVASDGASVSGDVAHDSADAGEPVKIGMKAVALKTNPTEVAANDRTNWYADVSGVPFVLGGHPNILSQSLQVTDADGAQTDAAIITAGANVAVVVTKISVMADNANTGDVSVRIGFGTANTPAADAAQMLLFHPGIAPGSGVVEGSGSGILGIGASNEDVRVTCEDPAGGSINIIVTYFTTDI